MKGQPQRGFTLIELSIVLVIIGLIVGGVLVGQDLIRAGAMRAQISQIEKYNTAVNTFREKYGALPGDLNATTASQFNLTPRASGRGQGDGNGTIEGWSLYGAQYDYGVYEGAGETALFWVDLSAANGLHVNLIDGGFSIASATSIPTGGAVTVAQMGLYFPQAKIGNGNFVYVYSDAGVNYFGISVPFNNASQGNAAINSRETMYSQPGMTVQQAYAIDKKMDDGIPQSGNVIAVYVNDLFSPAWAGVIPSNTAANAGTSSSCYDNGGSAGTPQQYSVGQSNGNGVNCALSFRFQ